MPQDRAALETPTAFSAANARRVARATTIVEKAYRLPPLPGAGYLGNLGGLAVAKTGASGLSARAGTTAGSGDITLQDVDESGVMTDTETTLTAWNLGDAVAADTLVLVAFGPGGPWIVVEPCS
jgi:hypothetical protein